ncbi:MAG TPA: DUF4097 family beta strand repeat-containing protein [Pyrinomonadaceae bacterium]|nr:DUF4097 family beta strand repeat-containing protein [Pyrinomonadaceae bacterium]
MKIPALTILLALALPLTAGAQERQPHASAGEKGAAAPPGVERKIAAAADVSVSLCMASGSVVVRGWDKGEVHARSDMAGRIDLREGKSGKGVEVLVSDYADDETGAGHCNSTSDVELDVPRGARVQIRVREGDVDIDGVAEARVESLNGDVDVRRVTRAVDVSCLSGDVSLSDSKGRARLHSVSGSVEAMHVSPAATGDEFEARSTSGDVSLERVGHASVKGATTSGSVRMSGPLVGSGLYEFTTHSGDVTMELPPDSSFRVNARIIHTGEVITDFPVRATLPAAGNVLEGGIPQPPPPPPPNGKVKVKPPMPPAHTGLVGVVGKGGAELRLTTFSGTVYLKQE